MSGIGNKSVCAAVILAAGSFTRMNGVNKQLALLSGVPAIARALLAFERCPEIKKIVVVARREDFSEFEDIASAHGISKLSDVVEGGATRLESSYRGVLSLRKDVGLAAIHDGARALVTPRLIGRVARHAERYGAAAPAIPVKDTIKKASGGIVTETLDRETLFAVQTPQAFDRDLIKGALYKSLQDGAHVTDDCQAVERIGMSVCLVEGEHENIKITTREDITLAEAILRRREMP